MIIIVNYVFVHKMSWFYVHNSFSLINFTELVEFTANLVNHDKIQKW